MTERDEAVKTISLAGNAAGYQAIFEAAERSRLAPKPEETPSAFATFGAPEQDAALERELDARAVEEGPSAYDVFNGKDAE